MLLPPTQALAFGEQPNAEVSGSVESTAGAVDADGVSGDASGGGSTETPSTTEPSVDSGAAGSAEGSGADAAAGSNGADPGDAADAGGASDDASGADNAEATADASGEDAETELEPARGDDDDAAERPVRRGQQSRGGAGGADDGVARAGAVAGNFCSTGIWSLALDSDAPGGDPDYAVYQVGADGELSSELSGWFRGDSLDALAIRRDGTTAFTASIDADGDIQIQRLNAQLGASDILDIDPVDALGLARFSGGAINELDDTFYFGGFNAAGGFELFAIDITQFAANPAPASWTPPAHLGTVTLPGVASTGSGDLVFNAAGDLLLLWSDGASGTIARLQKADLPTASATVAAGAAQTLSGSTAEWNGLAYDSVGQLWVQGTSGADTRIGKLDAATGAVTDTVDAADTVSSDLASCGSSVTLTVTKDIVSVGHATNGRARTGDQFTIDVRPEGSSQVIASSTTTGATTGAQTASRIGPIQVTPGDSYSIGEVGANGASLANYTIGGSGTASGAFECTWSGDGASVLLPISTQSGRAQATVEIPAAGRDGQALNCVIRNEAKPVAERQPVLELKKNIGSRAQPGDQFELRVGLLNDTSPLASATTSGSTTGLQNAPSAVATTVANVGTAYTISERGASSADLSRYTASYECTWSGGGQLTRGALSESGGRMQAALPAIPGNRYGQTLTCTITNTAKPTSTSALDCRPDTVYAIRSSNQEVRKVTAPGGLAAETAFTTGGAGNGLAINRDGSAAFLATGGSSSVTIRKWAIGQTAAQGVSGVSRDTGQSSQGSFATLVAGAVDPTTGIYYFGGYTTEGGLAQFQLFAYDEVNNPTRYWQAAKVNIPESGNGGNGDIAFDAQGNLYFVWSPAATGTVLARLDAASILQSRPAAVPAAMTATKVANLAGTTAYNGIAFDSSGRLFVSVASTVTRLNPVTGAPIDTPVTGSSNIVDLASCGLPPTMRLQKEIPNGLVNSADRFRISIFSGTTEAQFAQTGAIPNESSWGVQPQAAGPMVVTVGQAYRIEERITNRTGGLDDYLTGFSCTWSDEDSPVASGVLNWQAADGGTRRFADLPAIPSGKPGQQLNCTITNEPPVSPSIVTARKQMYDARGQNPVNQAGWEMNTQIVTGTPAGTTIVPADPPYLDPNIGTSPQVGTPKTTGVSGAVGSPWRLAFETSRDTAALRLWETGQVNYGFRDGSCTVTPRFGQAFQTAITPAMLGGQSSGQVTIQGPTDSYGNPLPGGARNLRAGDRVECTFRNQPEPGSVTWQKVDAADTDEHLAGSEWALTGPGVPPGTVIVDCVSGTCTDPGTSGFFDADPRPGYFEVARLSVGNHTLTERTAPSGFTPSATVHRFITALTPDTCNASDAASGVPKCLHVAFDEPFENSRREMPLIPLTGGLGTLAFIVASAALVALGLTGAWWHQNRRRRSSQT